ncbi:hypothetical protein [Actinomadura parmotrematis]|uniref:DUF4352 domain-containing protein n=1 Tax=Actinomadura parmotrematis TaxID=2864039 RepID=A0ABS7FMK9_9ACTN|nr:hypothetical protein [Actinomadura parmotrematis]MBW8481611.1 hypothetical protein [Actinomadura parmotrematis]
MLHRGPHQPRHLAATGAVLALALALAGCGGGDEKDAAKQGPPPPASTPQPESEATAAPGAMALNSSTGLRKPVVYADKITVAITGIRYVRNKGKGPGEVTGQQLTLFTLRFTNGSAAPLDLNKVQVVAQYGPRKTHANPSSYADINDFYGTVAPGAAKSAAYAFALPATGYKAVTLAVKFDATHKTAVFAGSLRR